MRIWRILREREVELWRRRENVLLEASISRLEYIMEFEVESTASKGWYNTICFYRSYSKKVHRNRGGLIADL
jgi:hypothetical protein